LPFGPSVSSKMRSQEHKPACLVVFAAAIHQYRTSKRIECPAG
jgi:hypothetical protein